MNCALAKALLADTPIDQNASDRRNTIRSEDNLVWNGDYVNSKANNYNEGINNGQVQIYAPSSYNDGSPISHFDIALSPNELMEPHYVEFEDQGKHHIVIELRKAQSYVNGLTDGWYDFLNAFEKTLENEKGEGQAQKLAESLIETLKLRLENR